MRWWSSISPILMDLKRVVSPKGAKGGGVSAEGIAGSCCAGMERGMAEEYALALSECCSSCFEAAEALSLPVVKGGVLECTKV